MDEKEGLNGRSAGVVLNNPALLKRAELRRIFVVRQAEFEELLARIRSSVDSAQHMLLIGGRGMGKTTLLHRLAAAVQDEEPDLGAEWLPVCFPEEQYNLGELADFWLNCLELVATATGEDGVDELIENLVTEYQGDSLEEVARARLEALTQRHGKRLLLLVDNVDVVLSRIGQDLGARRLREVLQQEQWLMLIGTACGVIEATYDYGSPFYEMFRVVELPALNLEQSQDLLRRLGEVYGGAENISYFLTVRRRTLSTLSVFMGGNPRVITTLFTIVQQEPTQSLAGLLHRLLDQQTTGYKDRIDALPAQGQRVFNALARRWSPATADQIATDLRIGRGLASAQLHRLTDRGMVGKVRIPGRAIGFQVSERLFNTWCLMRSGGSSQQRLSWFLHFIELFAASPGLTGPARLLRNLEDAGLLPAQLDADLVSESRDTGDRADQPDLGPPELANLIRLCSAGEHQRAAAVAREQLRLDPGSALAALCLAYVLEQGSSIAQAAAVIETCVGQGGPPVLRLEQARLLTMVKASDKARQTIIPLLGTAGLPASSFVHLASDLVEVCDDSLAPAVRAIADWVLRERPESIELRLFISQLDLRLTNVSSAADTFESALRSTSRDQLLRFDRTVLDLLLAIADHSPDRALALLGSAGLKDRWLPLFFALGDLCAPGSGYLDRLSPELRTFTEAVEARIRGEADGLTEPRTDESSTHLQARRS